jgi:AcrR family transcriptional regulator
MSTPPARQRRPVWSQLDSEVRQSRLSRERIALQALDLADREGFEAVSMRRIAEELKVGTMSLYNYVETKDELISVMDDALLGQALVDARELSRGWRHGLTAIARSSRAVLLRHPWALSALQKAQVGPNAMRHFEQSLAAVAETGLGVAEKLDLIGWVDAYVFGAVLQASEAHGKDRTMDPAAIDAAIEFGLSQIRTGEFPQTVAAFGDRDPRTGGRSMKLPVRDALGLERQFDRGLQTLLDGAALRWDLTTPAPKSRKRERKR